jgi:hypothetical protein
VSHSNHIIQRVGIALRRSSWQITELDRGRRQTVCGIRISENEADTTAQLSPNQPEVGPAGPEGSGYVREPRIGPYARNQDPGYEARKTQQDCCGMRVQHSEVLLDMTKGGKQRQLGDTGREDLASKKEHKACSVS